MDDPEGLPTYKRPNAAQALDALSLSAWLDQEGIPASDPVRTLLEVAYKGEFGLEPDVSSCLNLLTYLSTDTTRLELFGESDERFRARQGNDIFAQHLAEGLEPSQLHLDGAVVVLDDFLADSSTSSVR